MEYLFWGLVVGLLIAVWFGYELGKRLAYRDFDVALNNACKKLQKEEVQANLFTIKEFNSPFTIQELKYFEECPKAYDLAIDYQDTQATMGEAMDYDCSFHNDRIYFLKRCKAQAQERIDQG